ncbi:hypothetical protein [Cryptosporangium phraense]|uniref:Uncharacterized protein n=1 Tax=Cryptosporangium phraense TaxID=2593070 RepID=A0A545ASN0_9ACTN|nr:hypothetical protein [Cryptosporangium phraense]TQS44346.1 hypothetical protein FL583_15550 [Cryptosporangium phraense]
MTPDEARTQLRALLAERQRVTAELDERVGQAIAAAVEAPIPVAEIAEIAGLHRNTVGRIAKQYGAGDARKNNRPANRPLPTTS